MATNVQRASAILDALVDGAADPTVLGKVGDAYSFIYQPGEVLTNQQKAGVFLHALRRDVKGIVRDAIRSQAAAAAADAADSDIDIDIGVDS